MNLRRVAVGTVVLGLVANAMDYVANNYVLANAYLTVKDIMNPAVNVTMYMVGDFVGAFMLMLAWDMVGSTFGKGPASGAKFGLAAGLFISFPAWLFFQMQLKGFPYSTMWMFIAVFVVEFAILGAIAAMLDRSAPSTS